MDFMVIAKVLNLLRRTANYVEDKEAEKAGLPKPERKIDPFWLIFLIPGFLFGAFGIGLIIWLIFFVEV